MDYSGSHKRIVVLGGGFAGAYAVRRLSRMLPKGWEVTLIDKNNFLLFYPLLVEAGVGSIEPRHVVVPLRDFVRDQDFRMAEVTSVDLKNQQVHFKVVGGIREEPLHYDHLVFALGSVTKFPPIPGLKEHAFQLKSLADSISLRDRAIRLLELANTVEDPEERKALLRIVVVGANFTGIELAGEYQDFLTDAYRSYRNIRRSDLSLVVLELSDRILPALEPDLAAYADRHLRSRGLDIRTGTSIKQLSHDEALLTNGERLRTYTCVWAAGIAPNPLVDSVEGLPREKGWIGCGPDMRVKGFENVWAAGDLAHIERANGKSYAATAQNASREGTALANNLLRVIGSQPTLPFEYEDSGSLAALGCRTAVAKVFGFNLSGFFAWWLYRTAYILKMPSWSRRFRIIMDWTIDLFFRRDVVQLGVHDINVGRQYVPIKEPPLDGVDGKRKKQTDANLL